jgi:hypothetical protein
MAYIGNSPANIGNYQVIDTIASSFNGSTTSFALTAGGLSITPGKSGQVLVSINGVLQQPDDSGSNGFRIVGSNVVFSSEPASGDVFWAVFQGQNVDIGTPSDDVVDTAHIKDNAITADKIASGAVVADIATGGITTAKIADDAVTADKLANAINSAIAANTAKTGITSSQANAITANTAKTGITSSQASAITANTAKTGITSGQTSAITANTAKVTNATHSGEVTGATALTIADNIVDEANLKVSNAPSNGYFLSAQSGNTGGMTWAEVDALPSQTGNAGKFLTTDATNASWAVLDTDANSTTKGLYEMANVISANYVIGNNNNAISAGPITINSSISVTIPSGSTWVIA